MDVGESSNISSRVGQHSRKIRDVLPITEWEDNDQWGGFSKYDQITAVAERIENPLYVWIIDVDDLEYGPYGYETYRQELEAKLVGLVHTQSQYERIFANREFVPNQMVGVEVVSPQEWAHGSAKGVCQYRLEKRPLVEVRDRENEADLAVTLVHEYAHALLNGDLDTDDERSKRELEAEAVGYIVGGYFGLDTSGSAFYLAAWEGDEPEAILDRLERISSTSQKIIDVVEGVIEERFL